MEIKLNFLVKPIKQKIRRYFELPLIGTPTLPQTLLGRLGLQSWFWSSIIVGLGPYVILVGPTLPSATLNWSLHNVWRNSLVYPFLTIYILLLNPIYRYFLQKTISDFLPLLPSDCTKKLEAPAYRLDRRHEWIAFIIGAIVGYLIGRPWELPNFLLIIYGFIGEGLMFGLLGWFIYSIEDGTRLLTILHDESHGFYALRPNLLNPLISWGIFISISFLGGGLIAIIFIGEYLLSWVNFIIFLILCFTTIFIFLSTTASSSLSAQFRIARSLMLFIIVALGGTLGYYSLEGWDLLDGLYMTIITLTTIGFGEARELDSIGKIYTIILSLVSIGIGSYAISSIAALIVEGDFRHLLRRQKMSKQISKLNNHIILCGVGQVGKQIALELYRTQTPFIVVEYSQEAIENLLRIGDIPHIEGDATEDEILRLAGIDRAKGLVAALRDDKENAFVVLTARSLNAKLRIVSRLTDEQNAEKLRKVGANEIVSTNLIGGLRMASVMIRPSVVNFLDEMLRKTDETLRVEETKLQADSDLINKTLGEAHISSRTGLLIVAIKSHDGEYAFNPRAQTMLEEGDVLIVIGTPDQLRNLKHL